MSECISLVNYCLHGAQMIHSNKSKDNFGDHVTSSGENIHLFTKRDFHQLLFLLVIQYTASSTNQEQLNTSQSAALADWLVTMYEWLDGWMVPLTKSDLGSLVHHGHLDGGPVGEDEGQVLRVGELELFLPDAPEGHRV